MARTWLVMVLCVSVAFGSLRGDYAVDGVVNLRDYAMAASGGPNQRVAIVCERWLDMAVQCMQLGGGAFVDSQYSTSLNMGTSSSSVSLWVKLTSVSGNLFVGPFIIAVNSSGVVSAVAQSSSEGPVTITSTDKIAFGAWQHIAVVCDRSGTFTMYINGVVQSSTSDVSTWSGNMNNPTYTLGYSSGRYDDLRVYKAALSSADVAEIYAGGSGIVYAALASGKKALVTWQFNESSYASGYTYSTVLTTELNVSFVFNGVGTKTPIKDGIPVENFSYLQFDGTGYVDIPVSTAMQFGTDSFSIAFWARPFPYRSGSVPLFSISGYLNKPVLEETWQYVFNIEHSCDYGVYGHNDGDGNFVIDGSALLLSGIAASLTSPSESISIGADAIPITDVAMWHHYAFVVDRTLNTIKVYFDGRQVGSGVDISSFVGPLGTTVGSDTAQCRLGQYHADGWLHPYQGALDDLRIFKGVVITATDILALYNLSYGTKSMLDTTAVETSAWAFDGTVKDVVANLTGTITGGVTYVAGGVPFDITPVYLTGCECWTW